MLVKETVFPAQSRGIRGKTMTLFCFILISVLPYGMMPIYTQNSKPFSYPSKDGLGFSGETFQVKHTMVLRVFGSHLRVPIRTTTIQVKATDTGHPHPRMGRDRKSMIMDRESYRRMMEQPRDAKIPASQ